MNKRRESDCGDAGPDEAEALREGWTALDQLVERAGVTRLDLASQTRLIAEVGRRARRQRIRQWGVLAAAACLLLAVTFAWTMHGDGDGRPVARQPSPAATMPTSMASLTGTRPQVATVGAARTSATFDIVRSSAEPLPWSDPLLEELQSARAYAGEMEQQWRRGSDRWLQLHDDARRLELEWNDTAL